MGVIGGVAGGAIGVMEAAAGAVAESIVGIAADDRTYRRGVWIQDEIFSQKRGGGDLSDSPRAEIYCGGEEVYTVDFTPHWSGHAEDQSLVKSGDRQGFKGTNVKIVGFL